MEVVHGQENPYTGRWTGGRGGRGSGTQTRLCKYFLQGTCQYGARCSFSHGQAPPAQKAPLAPNQPGQSSKDAFRRLARKEPPIRHKDMLCDLLYASIGCLSEDPDLVVKALGSTSSEDSQLTNARQHFKTCVEAWMQPSALQGSWQLPLFSLRPEQLGLDLLLPVLKVCTHSAFIDHLDTSCVNTFLAHLKLWMMPRGDGGGGGLQACANWLAALHARGWKPEPQAPTIQPTQSGRPAPWHPASWFDVLQPVASLVCELLRRFQGQEDFAALKQPCQVLLQQVQDLCTALGSALEGERRHMRQLRNSMDEAWSLLQNGQVKRELLTAQEGAQRDLQASRAAAAARRSHLDQLRLQDPNHLPGNLRPKGPRHDNDHQDYTQVQVMPTARELLSEDPPYLPPNKPGGIPHLSTQPVRALLETHFRLLRQDVVAPVALAVQRFKDTGGLRALARLDKGDARGRLRLGSDTSVYVFRQVRMEGFTAARDGVHLQVSFKNPPNLDGKTQSEREQWWKMSRRLAHGTLCVFWVEREVGAVLELELMLAVVSGRDPKLLSKVRPEISVRMFKNCVEEAVKTFLASTHNKTGFEVVMLQENNAFFAYEPVLKSLQAAHTRSTPLDRYLAPSVDAFIGSARAQVGLPTYLLDDGTTLDLTCLLDKDRMAALSGVERVRVTEALQRVKPSTNMDSFPLAELMAGTTLDAAQSRALAAGLMREVAVIQGPPGTGKTFLGVKLMTALLRNARRLFPGRLALDVEGGDDNDAGCMGPVLVVCFTNHALDSFLEGLLDAGIERIVRVGSSTRTSPRLQSKNLEALRMNASGRAVKSLLEQKRGLEEKLKQLNEHLKQVNSAELVKSLPRWEAGGEELVGSALGYAAVASFSDGQRVQRATLEDGWEQVATHSKPKDLLQDWLTSSPYEDWKVDRLGGHHVADVSMSDQLVGLSLNPEPIRPPQYVLELEGSKRPLQSLLQALRDGESVWRLSSTERQWVAGHLRQQHKYSFLQDLRDLQDDLDTVQARLQVEYDQVSLDTLRNAHVVGMTTSGVAQRKDMVSALAAKVVMVEEAAEVFEAHVLICLSRHTQHLLLIGDHEQLRPKPNLYELQAISNRGLDLDISLFERLVTQSGFPLATLEQQRRMRPDISRLLLPIYPNLKDHPQVATYPAVKGMTKPLFLLDHDHSEAGKDDGRSHSNPWEAAFCVRLARYLLQQGYTPKDIVILVPYVGQLKAVQAQLRACDMTVVLSDLDKDQLAAAGLADSDDEEDAGGSAAAAPAGRMSDGGGQAGGGSNGGRWTRPGPVLPVGTHVIKGANREIRVATIDNFQGEEAKIILLSLTRNNKEGNIGFLKMRNRICVMISRAQHGMYILGNTDSLKANTGRQPLWPQVLSSLEAAGCIGPALEVCCQRHGKVTQISRVEDFQCLVGDGGCEKGCDALLDCGHPCPRRCHADDPDHLLAKCTQACDRLRPCQHPCPKRCHEECDICLETITEPHPLPCGHTITGFPCYKRDVPDALQCTERVQVLAPCGHSQSVPCHERRLYESGAAACNHEMIVTMPLCGHEKKTTCAQAAAVMADPTRCTADCQQLLPCEHTCQHTCGACLGTTLKTPGHGLISGFPAGQALMAAANDDVRLGVYPRWVADLTQHDDVRDAWVAWLKDRFLAAPDSRRHLACKIRCDRNLVCGHPCASACHKDKPCPPCKQACWISCSHTKCGKPCGAVCTLCAGKCTWRCAHQGACTAPCAAPCDRLPCDERCSKLLACGHRCPGLCGETCPKGICLHPDCKANLPEKFKDQVVDFIMQSTLDAMSDDEVDADPLVLLDCGHVLTTSTLDGLTELSKYYRKDESTGKWAGVRRLPASFNKPPACPGCRQPIKGVQRLGRVVNTAALDLVDRKFMDECNRLLMEAHTSLADDEKLLQQNNWSVKTALDGIASLGGKDGTRQRFLHLIDKLDRPPKKKVFDAALSRKLKNKVDTSSTGSAGPSAPGSSGSTAQMGPAGRAAVARFAQAAGSRLCSMCSACLPPSEGSNAADDQALCSTCAALPSTQEHLQEVAARAAVDHVLQTDYSQLHDARCGLMRLVQLQMQLAEKAYEQWEMERAGLIRSMPLGSRAAAEARAEAMLTAAMQLHNKMLSYHQNLLGANPGQQSDGAALQWLTDAVSKNSYTRAFKLMQHLMGVVLHWVSQLRAFHELQRSLGVFAGAVGLPSRDETKEHILEELGQMDALESQLEMLMEQGQATADAKYRDKLLKNPHYQAARQHVRQAHQIREAVEADRPDAAMLEILIAVARAEYGGREDPLDYLSRHLFRCPNGHLYTIGECGMAMEESGCPECGRRIGGGSHQLRGDNQSAGDVVQQLRQHGS